MRCAGFARRYSRPMVVRSFFVATADGVVVSVVIKALHPRPSAFRRVLCRGALRGGSGQRDLRRRGGRRRAHRVLARTANRAWGAAPEVHRVLPGGRGLVPRRFEPLDGRVFRCLQGARDTAGGDIGRSTSGIVNGVIDSARSSTTPGAARRRSADNVAQSTRGAAVSALGRPEQADLNITLIAPSRTT